MEFDELPEITTLSQLSTYLCVSQATVRRAIKAEKLKAFKAGKNYRFKKADVTQWLQQK